MCGNIAFMSNTLAVIMLAQPNKHKGREMATFGFKHIPYSAKL